ncbi:hypothetical protein D3C84_555160 [compost metagenome]
MANRAPVRASSSTSPVREENSTFTPLAVVMGSAAAIISCRARMISPRPMPTRPSWPRRVCLRERKKITPKKINSGDSQDRSRVSTRAISAVPTSAPSMMASAGASSISPWATKELTSSAVALLLCTRAVTPIPAAKASGRRRTLRLSRRRRLAPYTRRIPDRTMCVPQMSKATAESRLSSVSMVALLAISKAAVSMRGATAAQSGEW